jgi:hypothetical protein
MVVVRPGLVPARQPGESRRYGGSTEVLRRAKCTRLTMTTVEGLRVKRNFVFVVCLLMGAETASAQRREETIRLHPQNPHYFLYRGKAVALVSSAEQPEERFLRLRTSTPCVAVNSRSNSNLLTVAGSITAVDNLHRSSGPQRTRPSG